MVPSTNATERPVRERLGDTSSTIITVTSLSSELYAKEMSETAADGC